MSDRFYINYPLAPGAVTLSGAEAHHLAVVCRVRAGDAVCLFNGDGYQYPATVTDVSRRSVAVHVDCVEKVDRELGFRLEVAAPLPKGDRAEFLVEKLTELGVTHYVPLRTRRSVIDPRAGKIDKLHRQVIEASKQCGRNVLLKVEPVTAWDDYCRRPDLPEGRWLADPEGEYAPLSNRRGIAIAIGPEGGFTSEEIDAARKSNWRLTGLGKRVLRVETAAVALAALAARAE
jgi:16S rRNA (uracil1498-N3)-methyltransferase